MNYLTYEEEDIEGSLRESLNKRLIIIFESFNHGSYKLNLKSEDVIEEVYIQVQNIKKKNLSDTDFQCIHECFNKKFKSYHAASIGMMMLYGVIALKKQKSIEELFLMRKIEKKYKLRPELKEIQESTSLISEMMLIQQKQNIYNLYVNNQFTGEIKQMQVAHSDVVVGIAETGSEVYHRKINQDG